MDLNLLLLFTGVSTSALLLFRLLYARPPELLAHALAPCLVLLLAAVAYRMAPESAGYLAGAACGLLVLGPAYAALPINKALLAERFGRARVLAFIAAVLNPIKPRFQALRVIAQLEAISTGKLRAADLDAHDTRPAARWPYLNALAAEGRHADLLAYCERIPIRERERDVGLLARQVRALGETGQYAAMVALAQHIQRLPGALQVNADVRMMAMALLGQVELTDRFALPRVRWLGAPIVQYWQATARAQAGDEGARAALEALTHSALASVRRGARLRLEHSLPAPVLSALPECRAYIDELRAELASAAGLEGTGKRMFATPLLALAIGLMFLVQLPGGATDARNLIELGALVLPPIRGFDQPWRLLSAAFLHYGFAHCALNVLGLLALGRRIEGAFGSLKLLALFVGSAVIGNVVALFLVRHPAVIVGASGGVLGLFGGLAALVVHRRRTQRTRFLAGALREVLVIVALQIAFDLVMPNVSSLVHVGGFVSGFGLGLLLLVPAADA